MQISRKEELQIIAESLRDRAKQLALEIGERYRPRFTSTQGPENEVVARARLAELVEIRAQVEIASTEITAAWTEHPLRREDMKGAKAPLRELAVRIEAEQAFIKSYLRSLTPAASNTPLAHNWKEVCCGALERAVNQGFELLPEEQEILDQLRAFKAEHR